MAEENKMTFEEIQKKLQAIDVSGYVEKKGSLTYLSWSYAWGELIKVFPRASYEIEKFDGLPYLKTEEGYMVFTKVTIEDQTREMWLHVMDNSNRALKVCDMGNINKTIMRCLVKNIAMFGLGLNLYQGEDLPNVEEARVVTPKEKLVCASCGKEITDHPPYGAEAIAKKSKQEFGQTLCFDCSVKAKKGVNNG